LLKILKNVSLQNCEIVKPFLKLAYSWSELNGTLVWYSSPKYKLDILSSENNDAANDDTSATNLSQLHPYLDSEDWTRICKICLAKQDPGLTSLIVRTLIS
jgi:hypothetical protein